MGRWIAFLVVLAATIVAAGWLIQEPITLHWVLFGVSAVLLAISAGWLAQWSSMFRWVLFLIVLVVVAFAAGELAENSGVVVLRWFDYEIQESVGLLILELIILLAVALVLYRLWISLRRAPRSIRQAGKERRQRRGYESLSRGLVAVAAGDAAAARKHAHRAESLVDDRPLTMLLSAQAAQLDGNEQAAEKFFTSMREQPETEFLGVRGLLTQALKREDWDTATQLARRAYRLKPKSEWVINTLYELQKRTGKWQDAEVTLGETSKLKLVPPSEVPRERADLQYRQSLDSSGEDAVKWARKAHRSDITSVPAAVRLAELLIAGGQNRKASDVLEETWQHNPDIELAEVYWKAQNCDDAVKKVQAAKRLAKRNPVHPESRIMVATAALEARMWDEARSNLEPIAGDDASPRVCRLMAELEEAEHGDLARARLWLMRATRDEHAPGMSSVVPQLEPKPAD